MTSKTAESFLTRRFQAMSCPCEILIDTQDAPLGAELLEIAVREAARIENKYSRFLPESVVSQINRAGGQAAGVDDETRALLAYAQECYEISGGLFDIKRGGTDIDLGGICKEYAADRILGLLRQRSPVASLVNLGGDISAAGDRLWSVGIENASRPGQIARTIHIRQGGVATSGTTKRPGHILHPKTGLPITEAPLSVTVAAKSCTEAGFWSTLALLQGLRAEKFLEEQQLEYWCYRS
jgi:FAD:protein FMN transferase